MSIAGRRKPAKCCAAQLHPWGTSGDGGPEWQIFLGSGSKRLL